MQDLARGHEALLQAFKRADNLSAAQFAASTGKSREKIHEDIDARRLLALDTGDDGQRIPAWQLEPNAQRLTGAILDGAPDVDAWTIYQALTTPLDVLDERSAVQAVTSTNAKELAATVLARLGVQPRAK